MDELFTLNYQKNPGFYAEMTLQNIEVGALIQELSMISHSKSVQIMSWWISILGIFTSIIGVGVGLISSLENQFRKLQTALL